MSNEIFEAPVKKKRPSIFWWVLAHLVAIALAVTSWTICLVLFNYPERPRNYDWLRKLGRLDPVVTFESLEAPDGSGADPTQLYDKYARLNPEQLTGLNQYLRRNYITNFKNAKLNTYVEGSYRVIQSRPLRTGDFFHPGLVLSLQGYVQPDEEDAPTPYPVFVDVLLPLAEKLETSPFEPGDTLELGKIKHRTAVFHVSKESSQGEPAYHLTAVPLTASSYKNTDGTPLKLRAPDPLNLAAPIPATKLK